MAVSVSKPETLTQAYHAGVLIAMIENYLPKEDIPPVIMCVAQFYALRTLLGERLWQKLKASSRFAPRVRLYESTAYQPTMPKAFIGTYRDFFLGYVKSYEKSSLKRKVDKARQASKYDFS